ncbi:MAG: Stp1/IreP family PP2C-type Ser/Thr phosphatase [Acidobacteriia bacterium]|nr:Stp1/IreP family PP2C-type Ser/Thr phosphatase [Terriglobia bacterium]
MKIRAGIELGNLTDVGCHRTHNEDYYCYTEPEGQAEFARKGRLMVIADGMGGHCGGEVASGIAVEVVRATYLASNAESLEVALVEALHAAHVKIREVAREHPELEGLGTTCIAAVLRGSELTYAHVGDSRLYLVRNSEIRQLTQDQTVVNRLLEQGALTPEEAATHPDRGVLTAAVGVDDAVAAEVPEIPIALHPADVLLMCTDGLHDLVKDQELAAAATASPPAAACRTLIELAKSRGGFDNITVQILKFEESS